MSVFPLLTLSSALGLGIIALLGFAGARSLLAPQVLFPAYWAFTLIATLLIRIGDHALTPEAILVFTLGAALFSLAAAAGTAAAGGLLPGRRARSPLLGGRGRRAVQTLLIVYGLGLIAMVPAFILAIRAAAEAAGITSFAVAARASLLLADRGGIPHFFSSLTSLGTILAYYAAWMYRGSRRDRVTLVTVTTGALLLSMLSFSRTAVVALLIGVLGIMAMQRTVRTRAVVLLPLVALVIAITMGTLLSTGPEFDAGGSKAYAVIRNLAVYFIGGPLGFAAVMDDPLTVGERMLSLRFFTQPASWIGLGGELPSLILDYTSIELGNVYTLYFAHWLDWGWAGVAVAAATAGVASGVIFALARSGGPFAGASYAIVIGSCLTSAVGDGFFTSAMPWLLVIGVGWALQRVAAVAERSAGSRYAAVSAQPATGVTRV